MLTKKKVKVIVGSPDELVDGMAEMIMECGYNCSFLEDRPLGADESWRMISRVITNPLSLENKIFRENIRPRLEAKAKEIEAKMKEEEITKILM
jgi:hypothetical protein